MTTQEVLDFYGGYKAASKALNVTTNLFRSDTWDPEPPKLRQFQIYLLTAGQLKINPEILADYPPVANVSQEAGNE